MQSPGVILASFVILTSLGVWGLPQMVHKFYAIRDISVVRPAIIISTLFAVLMAGGAYFTGALSRLFPGIPELAAAKQFDVIMPTVLTKALPEALVAVILLLVLSASMSTLAGLVMISGSAISVDLVQGEIKKDMSKKACGAAAADPAHRGLHPALGVLAQQKWQLIVNLMALSGASSPAPSSDRSCGALYWKRVTAAAVWVNFDRSRCCSWAGSATTTRSSPLTAGYIPVLAALTLLASLVITPLVSLLTPAPAADVVERAFAGGGADEVAAPPVATRVPEVETV